MGQPEQTFTGHHVADVKYGENGWMQSDGLYRDPENSDPLSLTNLELVQGQAPSYNNYCDLDRLMQTSTHIAAAFLANGLPLGSIALGAKHGNVCGAGVAENSAEAIEKMLVGDPTAIFGGSTLLNFDIDETAAQALVHSGMPEGQKRLLDIVAGASATDEAFAVLQRKEGKLRVLTNPALNDYEAAYKKNELLDASTRFRHVRGGFLAQQNYTFVPVLSGPEWDSASDDLKRDLLLAWGIGSTSTSNTITLVKDGQLIANGVGQQDRVSAGELALTRARRSNHRSHGAVAYSDSFFPFPDGPQTLANADIKAIFTTTGSVRDTEALAPFIEAGVTVFSLPDSEARGFYAH